MENEHLEFSKIEETSISELLKEYLGCTLSVALKKENHSPEMVAAIAKLCKEFRTY